MTVSETIAQGRQRVRSLQLDPTSETQLLAALDSVGRAVSAGRGKVSEALTILRAPELASRQAIANVAAADLLAEALELLDGTRQPEDGS